MAPRCHRWSGLVFFVLLFLIVASGISLYAQTAALQFVSVTPCRVVDTRQAPGQFGGPTMNGNTERDFPIPQSACSIPSTAAAYSLNVTVVPWGSLNYLTIWPAGQLQPTVSTLNSYDGRTKANAAIVPAGSNQAVAVYVTDKTDVLLDIDGYFVPASTSTLAFFPLTPCRVADTRWQTGPLGGPIMQANQTRDFPVLASSCSVPDSAQGYSLNMTVVPERTLAYLTLWPTGEPQPGVSTLNAPTGTVVANAAIVPAGTSGAISVYVTDETQVIIDINGYFAPAASGQGPLSLFSLTPCRVLDTRPPHGSGLLYNTLPVNVLGSSCNVPGAQAYVFNATVVPNGGPMGYLSLWPDAEGQPVVSTLNAYDGAVTSNMAIVPTLNGDVDAYAYNPAWLIMDIFSYFAPILPLDIITSSLPAGTVNYNYSATLLATGGVQPYTWSIVANNGSLPPGLNLDASSGTISGTPTTTGNYPFGVEVTDSETPPVSSAVTSSITINSTLSQLTIVTTGLRSGTQNSPYSVTLQATGGVTPYTWSINQGSLPPGLTLNASTGAITGTPSGAGVTNFQVGVEDSESPTETAVRALSITITPAVPLSVSTTSLPSGTAGTVYSAPITAIGGVYPYTWSVTSGTLPSGLTLNSSTGVISGTPQNVGSSTFTVQVVDSETPPVTASSGQLSITIASPGGNGNPGLLSGNYAFYLNGWNSSTPWTLAGSFISNGNGNITSGVIDGNSVTGSPYTANISGTYAISTTNLNTITIQGSGWGPMTLAFDLDSSGNGRIIEYDDTTGQGSRGSGALRKATASAFSLSALSGTWAFGMTGADHAGRFVNAGVFSVNSSGSMTNGECDTNEAGDYTTCTFSGTVSAVNSQTGRTTATVQSSNGPAHNAVYVVSSSEMLMTSADSDNNGQPMQVGEGLRQSGPFSNSSLNGLAVFYMQSTAGSEDESGAGIISSSGNGNATLLVLDSDNGGTITEQGPGQLTYSVASNGALTFTGAGNNAPAGFLISQNKAFTVSTGSNPDFSWWEPQTGGPFSNASLDGAYAGGTLAPLDYSNSKEEIDATSGGGTGTMTVSSYTSGSDGLDQGFGTIVNYSMASNGRGTAEAQGDEAPSVVYMISPTRFVILWPKTDARIGLFQH